MLRRSENPYPAALDEVGLPVPAGIYVVSPWTDLTFTGDSMTSHVEADPSVAPAQLMMHAAGYAGAHDPHDPLISPLFGNLAGLPPLLIQVGGNEVLLDDSTRLATRAAAAGVQVTLEVTPGVPHVFVTFAGVLDEADRALTRAGQFIRESLAAAGTAD